MVLERGTAQQGASLLGGRVPESEEAGPPLPLAMALEAWCVVAARVQGWGRKVGDSLRWMMMMDDGSWMAGGWGSSWLAVSWAAPASPTHADPNAPPFLLAAAAN
jgi:hypothetical protein